MAGPLLQGDLSAAHSDHDHERWTYAGPVRKAIAVLQYAYPIVMLVFFLAAFTVRSIAASKSNSNIAKPTTTGPGGKPLPATDPTRNFVKKLVHDDVTHTQKRVFEWVSLATAFTFVGNSVVVIAHALAETQEHWWAGKSVVIYLVGAFFVYCLFLISLLDSKPSPTEAHLATWSLATVLEIVLVALSFAVYTHPHKEPTAGPPAKRLRFGMTQWESAEVAMDLLRILLLLALITFYVLFVVVPQRKSQRESGSPSENTSLLGSADQNGHAENGHANGSYGSVHPVGGKHQHTEGAPPAWSRPTGAPARSWWEYIKGYHVFFPYLWPSKDRKLQLVVIACFLLVLAQRAVNVVVPDLTGEIVDRLKDPSRGNPWTAIMLYIGFRFLQGSNGLLGAARSALWIPVSQYSYRELSVAAFEHVHSLSLDFHLGKKTGEVLSALGKGSSINTFLEQVTFSVVPMLIDLAVAIAYFLVRFDAYYALVIAIITFWYIYLTIRMAQWRAEIRREMVNADREEDAVKNDSMVSYETVKYFNAEAYEFNRYREAVRKYQNAEYKVMLSLNIMNITQNMVFMIGLLVTCFIAAYQVAAGILEVGRFVSLLTYMSQLQSPLNFFGTFYRMIQSAMINSERMLELFKEQPTVVDKEDAQPLASCEGNLRFQDVHFAYDQRKPALTGLDFYCEPGTTTAFVGESGGGKSTVFRLLYRFYNTMSGSIQVDGHDVEDLTIDSVRSHIGVVPQDTVLFNETLMYNLKYANPEATDEQVHEACRAASIHDKIMTFPDKYETKVGDRGLRLSGGEKQRVAIARTILKNPRIIMLDEATAALDTETEQHIHEETPFNSSLVAFAKAAFSNLIGGTGYFYGSSLVQHDPEKPEIVESPVKPLFTAVPSRSFFPRGFVWDEGFHQIGISAFDDSVTRDVIAHWLGLMEEDGYIAREQILGQAARRRVPAEFVVQHVEHANPPTLLLALEKMLQWHQNADTDQEMKEFVRTIFPFLKRWYSWFLKTQYGPHDASFRWRGRHPNDGKLISNTLSSGLDDYPRASLPSEDEMHVDLLSWMIRSSNIMAKLAAFVGQDSDVALFESNSDHFFTGLDKHHWNEEAQSYFDVGEHSEDGVIEYQVAVRCRNEQGQVVDATAPLAQIETKQVKCPTSHPNFLFPLGDGRGGLQMLPVFVPHTTKLQHVKHVGYVSVFPLLLKVLPPDSPKLLALLKQITDPTQLWSPFGLRSLSTLDQFYEQENAPGDNPYWRGSIWMNANYLALDALHHYAQPSTGSPFRKEFADAYTALRANVIANIYREYERTGYLWEQYSGDIHAGQHYGHGQRCHPFSGWTALVVNIMAEMY